MPLDFTTLFPVRKPIIGMIHLAGSGHADRVKRALDEMALYQEEGIDGAIIEDYHGNATDVYETVKQSNGRGLSLVRGVNLLSDPYLAFNYAGAFGARFVQFDSIETEHLNFELYQRCRQWHPKIQVLGGVRFKCQPESRKSLEQDLKDARSLCEAVVTTGPGTGVETPLSKLQEFRHYLDKFPLITGAGVTRDNVEAQLEYADAAIVGSYFKPAQQTMAPVERSRVRDLMDVVRLVRQFRGR